MKTKSIVKVSLRKVGKFVLLAKPSPVKWPADIRSQLDVK